MQLSSDKIDEIAQVVYQQFAAGTSSAPAGSDDQASLNNPNSHTSPAADAITRSSVIGYLKNRQPTIPDSLCDSIAQRVLALASGLGPLQELMEDEAITEIMVNGPGVVFVEREGSITPTDITLATADIEYIIERIVAPLGVPIDRRQPFADARLGDEATRVNIIIPPLAIDGPCITIRRFGTKRFPLEAFTDAPTADRLRQMVRDKTNLVVSGGTGSGKTTLLNALAGAIPDHERIITIEDAAEMQLASSHVVRLETRPANPEGIGAIDARALLRNALRMRPDRIIIGEVRGSEVFEMLQAMNTGHEGSLSTCHANSVDDTLRRLEMMALLYSQKISHEVIREQLASTIKAVVHTRRTEGGGREISEIAEFGGGEVGR